MEQLEKTKLELEIKKLKAPWYSNIEFWKVIIPTIAILVTLYFTVGQGLLDSEKRKLELQKEQLKLEILQFEGTKSDIQKDILNISTQRKDLENKVSLLTFKKDSLDKVIQSLIKQTKGLLSENKTIKNNSIRDKNFYQAEIKKQYELDKSRLKELANLKGSNNRQRTKIAELSAQLDFLNKRVKLSEIEKNDFEIVRSTAAAKELEKQSNEYEQQIIELNKNLKEELKRIDKMSSYELLKFFELRYL